MTLIDRLTYHLDAARRIGDLAATTMLTARIRRLRAREREGCANCGSRAHVMCNRGYSELELRWLNGDR